ncbi:MAG: ribosome maturation factor RimP [Betaproteobacteria bacterium]|nr:ribosome maturation factor RimP [Betaproteobacteria bacterium]
MELAQLLDTTITGLGFELVDVELPGRGRLIRLFIDRSGGITVDDCAFVSHHLSRVLAVENIDYDRLEVSSPGLDRPLKSLRDFERFAGQQAELKLRLPLNGRKRFAGTLKGVADQAVLLEVEGALLRLQMADLDKARLVPKL